MRLLFPRSHFDINWLQSTAETSSTSSFYGVSQTVGLTCTLSISTAQKVSIKMGNSLTRCRWTTVQNWSRWLYPRRRNP